MKGQVNLLDLLDTVFPQYKRVDQAPKFDFFASTYRKFEDLERAMQHEETKRYKAINSEKIVYLLQNPALIAWRSYAKLDPIPDIIRERQGSIEDCRQMIVPKGEASRGDTQKASDTYNPYGGAL